MQKKKLTVMTNYKSKTLSLRNRKIKSKNSKKKALSPLSKKSINKLQKLYLQSTLSFKTKR